MNDEQNRFRVVVNSMGRVTIPLKYRDILKIEPMDILTITIDEVVHRKDLEEKSLGEIMAAFFKWVFRIQPSGGM